MRSSNGWDNTKRQSKASRGKDKEKKFFPNQNFRNLNETKRMSS